MFSRFPLAGPRLPTLLLARSVSVSACAGAPGVGSTRLRRVAGLPRVLVDEAGRARRPLPPLNVAGAVATPQEGVTAVKPRKARAPKILQEAAPLPAASTSTTPTQEELSERSDVPREELDGSEGEAEAQELGSISPSPLEAQLRRDLARYPQAILLTQVGSFFESYFDQAPEVSRILGIKLTSKLFGKGTLKTRYPTCGFPLSQLSKHVSTLVSSGLKVVIVEEYREAGFNAGTLGEIGRRVTRIVTPGTGVDEGFVRPDEMNFVLAISIGGTEQLGLAWRDISTGASFTRRTSSANLRDDVLLIAPREIVVEEGTEGSELGMVVGALLRSEEGRQPWIVSPTPSPVGMGPAVDLETAAELLLLSYLHSTLVSTPPPNTKAIRVDPTMIMQMDSTTLQSLEIRGSLRGGVKGTLVSTVRRTVTAGGARLLVDRLCSPSLSLPIITARHSLVATFVNSPSSRSYLRSLLKPLHDTSRILQRLYLGRGNAFDLLYLKRTILVSLKARLILAECLATSEDSTAVKALERIRDRLGDHGDLARSIDEAIDEEALEKRTRAAEIKEAIKEHLGAGAAERAAEEEEEEGREGRWGREQPWVVKPAFSKGLTALHARLDALRREAHLLEASLRDQYEIKSLLLKIAPKLGAIVWVGVKSEPPLISIDKDAVLVAKTGSTRSYVVAAWSKLRGEIGTTMAELSALEDRTMEILVGNTIAEYTSLQTMSDAIDELDVALGFAELAREMNLVRPTMNDGTSLVIENGRHPTVEHSLKLDGRPFTTNSLCFSHPDAFVHCLTGPNMAGKSTFLRQVALIVIMAQAGSFVPAASAEIGLVDRVFSRVGARDELDRDRSTFMVEMDEATSILHNATDRSLVLFDELGRGTSPLDGLAIAYAALEHLVNVNRSRTLFATHYHRLGSMLSASADSGFRGTGAWRGVEMWCTDVLETQESVEYLHTVRRGLNNDSAGIIVARLAGMPARAIRVAEATRKEYEGVA